MQLEELHERLARIETTLESIHTRLFGNGQPGLIAQQDARLASLEAQRQQTIGAVHMIKLLAAIGPLVVAAVGAITEYILHNAMKH